MKKYVRITLFFVCILLLTACGNNQKIMLPKLDRVTQIEIMTNNSKMNKKIVEKDKISNIYSDVIENTKNNGKESVNDKTQNIDNYIVIKFYTHNEEENPCVIYLYKDKGMYYVEQPYLGIWKIKKEIYNKISSDLMK